MCKTCLNCNSWNNSDEKTSWNEQHKEYMKFPYKEYGVCDNDNMMNCIFQDSQIFGNYTHKTFGCVFFEQK